MSDAAAFQAMPNEFDVLFPDTAEEFLRARKTRRAGADIPDNRPQCLASKRSASDQTEALFQ